MSYPLTQEQIDAPTSRARSKRRGLSWWISRITVLVLAGSALLFLVAFLLVYSSARSDDQGPAGAIVVLGAAQFNGVPSQVFQARLDTAFELYQGGASEVIVVSGGNLPGDIYTEAESGRNYLIERGLPADAILMEPLSSDTEESMTNVAALLSERGIDDVLLVSDGFHLYRAKMLAEENGLTAQSNDADDSPIEQGSGTEFRYMIRETFAVVAHWLRLD